MDEGKARARETTKMAGRETTYFKILIKSSSTSIDMDDNGAARTVCWAKGLLQYSFFRHFFLFLLPDLWNPLKESSWSSKNG